MKRLISLLLFLTLCCAVQASARMNAYMAGSVAASAGSGKSCATTCATMNDCLLINKIYTDDFYHGATIDGDVWSGQGNFDPGQDEVICQFDTNIRNAVGSDNYRIEIWTMSGTALGTLNAGCTSSEVTISGSGTKQFTGLSCALTNGTAYAITITRHDNGYGTTTLGGGIYVAGTTNATISGNHMQWTGSTKARSEDHSGVDLSMKLYGYTP
jgi:hypothetical protein